jgi:polysaccharide biosynthesis/export protein
MIELKDVSMKRTVLMAVSAFLVGMGCAQQILPQTKAATASLGQQAPLPATIQRPSGTTLDNVDPGQDRAVEVTIASGDLLQIGLFGTDFSCDAAKTGCEARVSSSGNIVLPLIGAAKVAGLTVAQAEQVIAARLSQGGFYNNPQVTIVQKEYATQGISVLGEVQKPGIYPLLGPHTLLQAIAAAGGTTVKAGNNVTIVRGNARHEVDLSSPTSRTVSLMPGDTIVVSKAGIVYVVGDVHQPAGVVMESSGLTVLQAIAMAQGTNPTASLDKSELIRRTAKRKYEIPIPLRKILSNQAPDPQLQPGDILFVPTSTAKSAARRGLEAIVEAATGVVIYSRY